MEPDRLGGEGPQTLPMKEFFLVSNLAEPEAISSCAAISYLGEDFQNIPKYLGSVANTEFISSSKNPRGKHISCYFRGSFGKHEQSQDPNSL